MEGVVDNPQEWVADHIRRFLATGGHPRPGVDDLLLTTRGRRTGTLRRTALTDLRDGGSRSAGRHGHDGGHPDPAPSR